MTPWSDGTRFAFASEASIVSPSSPSHGCATWPCAFELGNHGLGDVDRDREADADVPVDLGVARKLRVDADHGAGAVDQRAARVAVVDRGIGLQRVVDREVVRRRDLAVDGGDDARGQRAIEPERVADGDDRVADLDVRGVAERQGVQGARGKVDLEDREIGRGVGADDLRARTLSLFENETRTPFWPWITCSLVRM